MTATTKGYKPQRKGKMKQRKRLNVWYHRNEVTQSVESVKRGEKPVVAAAYCLYISPRVGGWLPT